MEATRSFTRVREEDEMESRGISRRRVLQGLAAPAIVAAEAGLAGRARAEDKFTIASTGGS